MDQRDAPANQLRRLIGACVTRRCRVGARKFPRAFVRRAFAAEFAVVRPIAAPGTYTNPGTLNGEGFSTLITRAKFGGAG